MTHRIWAEALVTLRRSKPPHSNKARRDRALSSARHSIPTGFFYFPSIPCVFYVFSLLPEPQQPPGALFLVHQGRVVHFPVVSQVL